MAPGWEQVALPAWSHLAVVVVVVVIVAVSWRLLWDDCESLWALKCHLQPVFWPHDTAGSPRKHLTRCRLKSNLWLEKLAMKQWSAWETLESWAEFLSCVTMEEERFFSFIGRVGQLSDDFD